MIELEQKFECSSEAEAKVEKISQFLQEMTFLDSYWDTSDYLLMRNGCFLRTRDDSIELKIISLPNTNQGMTVAQEITKRDEISEYLINLIDMDYETLMKSTKSYAIIETRRRSYKYKEFKIDLDATNFGYNVGEIEIMVEQDKVREGSILLQNEFKDLGFKKDKKGKLMTYIERFNPDQYQILVSLMKDNQ
jgi:adenylate cyclase class IV